MNDRPRIDIGLVMVRNDRDGKPFTRVNERGETVPDPLLFTTNNGVPVGHDVGFSLWDVDASSLVALMSGEQSDEDRAAFSALQDGRMQAIAASGEIERSLRAHVDRRRIQDLERQLAARTGTPVR